MYKMCQDVEKVFLTKLSLMPPCEEELNPSASLAGKKKQQLPSPLPVNKAANINRGATIVAAAVAPAAVTPLVAELTKPQSQQTTPNPPLTPSSQVQSSQPNSPPSTVSSSTETGNDSSSDAAVTVTTITSSSSTTTTSAFPARPRPNLPDVVEMASPPPQSSAVSFHFYLITL